MEAQFATGKTLLRHAAPDLVAAAEAKLRGQPVDPGAIAAAAAALRARSDGARIDTLVLACTHFPLLADELRAAFGAQVAMIDGAPGIARRIATLTAGQAMARTRPDRALFTRASANLAALGPALARHGLDETMVL